MPQGVRTSITRDLDDETTALTQRFNTSIADAIAEVIESAECHELAQSEQLTAMLSGGVDALVAALVNLADTELHSAILNGIADFLPYAYANAMHGPSNTGVGHG